MGEHGDVVSSSPYCAAGLAARAPRFRAFGTAVAPRTASPRAAALVPATHGHLETEICEALGQNLSACIAQPLRMLSPPDHTIHAVSKQVSDTRTSAAGTITGAEQRWHCRRDRSGCQCMLVAERANWPRALAWSTLRLIERVVWHVCLPAAS